MFFKFVFNLVLSIICIQLNAQSVHGVVKAEDQTPLSGANIYWQGTTEGTSSGAFGDYFIEKNKESNLLIISFIGFTNDTIEVNEQKYIEIYLKPDDKLEEILVESKREGVEISNINTIKTESITSTELEKAACCDLAGCFETSTTVDAQTTNLLTNAKELRILGLSGVYNQILFDGLPLFQGLAYTYGINSIPGTLINNIYVAKGSNSVLQGYESISGQINIISLKPENCDKLFLNAYFNSFGEQQYNANVHFSKKKWSNLTAIHSTQPARTIDRDNDTFLDLPKIRRYSIYNRTMYGDDRQAGWNAILSLRHVQEERISGNITKSENSSLAYPQSIDYKQPELSLKVNYRFNNAHKTSLQFFTQFHDQNSRFGEIRYDANQWNRYFNIQHEFIYNNGNNLKFGFNNRALNIEETIINLSGNSREDIFDRNELINSLYAENKIFLWNDRIVWLLGLRLDDHNEHGLQFCPRSFLQYKITDKIDLRASFGRAWRTSNVLSDFSNLLSGSRLVFIGDLNPEVAYNYGINFTYKFEKENLSGYITTDFYRTQFKNQIFPDLDLGTIATVDNFDESSGKSISNAFQFEINGKLFDQFEAKIGYNFLDVFRTQFGEKQTLPFNAKHRLITSLGFQPRSKKFRLDLHTHWFSKKGLPNRDYHLIYKDIQIAPAQAYTILSGQFTYFFDKFEIYTGCENILDFRQKRPIVSWEDPYDSAFDTNFVWGPTKGREFYLGFRFRLN